MILDKTDSGFWVEGVDSAALEALMAIYFDTTSEAVACLSSLPDLISQFLDKEVVHTAFCPR